MRPIGQRVDGDFLKSIRAIANGLSFYPKDVRTMIGYAKSIALAGLSERESEVLEALCQGMSNKEMAEVLFVCLETIKSHVSTLIGMLGVKDRTQAVIFPSIQGCNGFIVFKIDLLPDASSSG